MWRDVAGCGGEVSGMCRGCVVHVSWMCRECVAHVSWIRCVYMLLSSFPLTNAEMPRQAFFKTVFLTFLPSANLSFFGFTVFLGEANFSSFGFTDFSSLTFMGTFMG